MAHMLSHCVTDGFRQEVAQALHKAGLPEAASLAEREPLQSGLLGALFRTESAFRDGDFWCPENHTQALLAVAADPMQPRPPAHVIFTKLVEAGVQDVLDAKSRTAPESPVEAERMRMRAEAAETKARELEEELQLLRAQNERNAERLSREGFPEESPAPASRATGPRPRRKVA